MFEPETIPKWENVKMRKCENGMKLKRLLHIKYTQLHKAFFFLNLYLFAASCERKMQIRKCENVKMSLLHAFCYSFHKYLKISKNECDNR